MKLELEDSRRLTGPNLLMQGPGAVLDVRIEDVPAELVLSTWEAHVRRLLDAIGWADTILRTRSYRGGASLAFSAPVDVLYAATEVNEAAWSATVSELTGTELDAQTPDLSYLKKLIADEEHEALLLLESAANRRGVAFLSDDDKASVGLGTGAQTWPVTDIPDPATLDWDTVHDIPVALVTGTNGKSTTVRLSASIQDAAGRTAGLTSTDYIRVGNDTIDEGDYSGPGGARTLLRDNRVEVALLEVARGGILRRGLALNHAHVAVVTNIAEDHLGEYGIDTLDDLAEAKLVVARALGPDDVLVLNADDSTLVRHAERLDVPICWFGLDEANDTLKQHIKLGGRACFVRDGVLYTAEDAREIAILPVSEVPITMGGAARHNIANSLAAVGLARALGISIHAIAEGLRAFQGDVEDNPGRGNFFEIDGVQVLVDFAHNTHALRALADTLARVPARRRLILIGQAGDRSDEEIRALTRAACSLHPDRVIATEFASYLRGRALGEVPAIIADELRQLGFTEDAIDYADDGVKGTHAALAWAKPGDLLLLLAHSDRDAVLKLLLQKSEVTSRRSESLRR